MRISYNARMGSEYRTPHCENLRVLVKPKSNFEVEFLLTCDRVGASRKLFLEYSHEDFHSLSQEKLEEMGLSTSQAMSLMTKVCSGEGVCSGQEADSGIRDRLIKMLRRDDALRLSEEVQARYAEQPESWTWKWQVTDDVQRQVCTEFGFQDSMAEGLDLLRSSMSLFPDDVEVLCAAHYLLHNIHKPCTLHLSMETPDIKLHALNGADSSVDAIVKTGRATVIIAGSHT